MRLVQGGPQNFDVQEVAEVGPNEDKDDKGNNLSAFVTHVVEKFSKLWRRALDCELGTGREMMRTAKAASGISMLIYTALPMTV
jgi:hypothetical protein